MILRCTGILYTLKIYATQISLTKPLDSGIRYAVYGMCMARTPKYGRPTNPFSFRPRPTNEAAIKALVEKTGVTRAEIADEALVIGLPELLRKHKVKLPKFDGEAQAA
jgi:hypothetical protein